MFASSTQQRVNHQANDKARVATAAAPKTRLLNPVIAPNAPLVLPFAWAVGLAKLVDEASTELELVVSVVAVTVKSDALPVAVPVPLEVVARVDELAVNEGELDEGEEAKLGAATA
jgi:hypothetical protein